MRFSKEILAFAQYVYWADLNCDRYFLQEGNTSETIFSAFSWFASVYVAIEGWETLKIDNDEINSILVSNPDGVELLRRARNAVYHFQKKPLDNRIKKFAKHYGSNPWVGKLHKEFLKVIRDYPDQICPYPEDRIRFRMAFYDVIGWEPRPNKLT